MAKAKKCKEHPDYQGLRKPRSGCEVCQEIYDVNNPDPEESVELDKLVAEHNSELGAYKKKYKTLLAQNNQLQRTLNMAFQMRETTGSIKIKPAPRLKKGNSEAAAVLVASDWHAEERVLRGDVSNLNEFDLEICDLRVHNFFRNSLRLLKMFQQDVNINTIVLALLGDFISNYLHEDNNETNLLPPMDAVIKVQKLLAGGIQLFLDETDCEIKIPCTFGNHGRTTVKKRSSNKVGTSLEYLLYVWLSQSFQNNPRVTFEIATGSLLYTDILGYTVRFHHGDDIRYAGGVGGITIPTLKAIANWNTGRHADLDVFGHWHQMRDLGSFICNGSLIGYNSYAVSIKAPFEPPMQAMFLIDKKRTPMLRRHTIIAPIMLENLN